MNALKITSSRTPEESQVDWDLIVTEHAAMVFRAAFRVLHDRQDSEDVMQEVLLESFRKQNCDNGDGALLRRMATLRAIDRLRQRVKTGELPDDAVDPTSELPEDTVAQQECIATLKAAIGRLPARDAHCFALRYIEGLDNHEIASHLGIGVSAVSTSLNRARRRLRDCSLIRSTMGEE